MESNNSIKITVFVIGLISMVSGVYLGIKEGISNEAIYGVFIGLTLFGTAFFRIDKWTEKEQCEVE